MKRYFKISMLVAILLSSSLTAILPAASSHASLKESSLSRLEDKKCEKCKRGDDGKMVCEPVPCP